MSSEPQQVRIVIADDYALRREALKRLLEVEANFKYGAFWHVQVVGEASDGAEANKLALELKPDILLLDSAMLRQSGLEALHQLRPPVRVILLAATAENSQTVEAIRLGVRGVVLKDSVTLGLLTTIKTVMAGKQGSLLGENRFSPYVRKSCRQ